MSRSLRLSRLPSMQPLVRFSGYLTAPDLTDAQVAGAVGRFLMDLKLWRDPSQLPSDWLTRDDSVLQSPPPGVTPVWGQGTDVSSASVIGDPGTPWRLLVGAGQLVVENVWLYEPQADPWPATDCLTCPSGSVGHLSSEVVRPPSAPRRRDRVATGAAIGSAVGGVLLGVPGALGGALLGGFLGGSRE